MRNVSLPTRAFDYYEQSGEIERAVRVATFGPYIWWSTAAITIVEDV